MKDNNNSKIILALLAGAAVGIAIGYFLNSDKKDELLNDLKEGASKFKDDLAEQFEKRKSIFEDLKNAAEDPSKNTTT
ncbi:MAG: YtxH domain-containing protein [Bacteroidota bacterium]|nr:YtxH domain-containing protein [Bacteroidota bacterium]